MLGAATSEETASAAAHFKYSLPLSDSFLGYEDWDNRVGLSVTFPVLATIYNKAFLTRFHDLCIHYSVYFNHHHESRGTAAELQNTRAEVFPPGSADYFYGVQGRVIMKIKQIMSTFNSL